MYSNFKAAKSVISFVVWCIAIVSGIASLVPLSSGMVGWATVGIALLGLSLAYIFVIFSLAIWDVMQAIIDIALQINSPQDSPQPNNNTSQHNKYIYQEGKGMVSNPNYTPESN